MFFSIKNFMYYINGKYNRYFVYYYIKQLSQNNIITNRYKTNIVFNLIDYNYYIYTVFI